MRRSMFQIARGIGNARRWKGLTGTRVQDSIPFQRETNFCINQQLVTDAGPFLGTKLKFIINGVGQDHEHRFGDRSAPRWTRACFSTRPVPEAEDDTLPEIRGPTADSGSTSYERPGSQPQKSTAFSLIEGVKGDVGAASRGGMGKKEWRQWINKRLAETKDEKTEDPEEREEAIRADDQHADEGRATEVDATQDKEVDQALESLRSLMASLEVKTAAEGNRPHFERAKEVEKAQGTDSLDDDFGLVKDFTELDEEEGFLRSAGDVEDDEDEDGEAWEEDEEIMELSPMHDLDDESRSFYFRPGRPFFPGQSYNLEELDLSVRNDQLGYDDRKGDRVQNTKQMLRTTDFRNVRFLSGYITETANIVRKSKTKTSSKAQRKLVREIKTARIFGLMPFTTMGRPPFRIRRLMYEPLEVQTEDE